MMGHLALRQQGPAPEVGHEVDLAVDLVAGQVDLVAHLDQGKVCVMSICVNMCQYVPMSFEDFGSKNAEPHVNAL
jgi:hypothetical protein